MLLYNICNNSVKVVVQPFIFFSFLLISVELPFACLIFPALPQLHALYLSPIVNAVGLSLSSGNTFPVTVFDCAQSIYICSSRHRSALLLGAEPVIRRNATCVPFPGLFSINQLFLFSEFVSWTIIDCSEPPAASRVASVYNDMEGRPWANKSLRICFHVPADLPAQERRGGSKGEDWGTSPELYEHLGDPQFGEVYLGLTLKFCIGDSKWNRGQGVLFPQWVSSFTMLSSSNTLDSGTEANNSEHREKNPPSAYY